MSLRRDLFEDEDGNTFYFFSIGEQLYPKFYQMMKRLMKEGSNAMEIKWDQDAHDKKWKQEQDGQDTQGEPEAINDAELAFEAWLANEKVVQSKDILGKVIHNLMLMAFLRGVRYGSDVAKKNERRKNP